jgi:hypothetical protein
MVVVGGVSFGLLAGPTPLAITFSGFVIFRTGIPSIAFLSHLIKFALKTIVDNETRIFETTAQSGSIFS